MPALLVDTVTFERVPPPTVTANVTCTRLTGLPNASVAFTETDEASGAPAVPAWALPPATARLVAGAGAIANAAEVSPASPAAPAASVYVPPAVASERSLKVATPATAATDVVPWSEAPAGDEARLSVT